MERAFGVGTEPDVGDGDPGSSRDVSATVRRFAVVIEDDIIVLMGLEAILRDWGYDVIAADSTEGAMERLSQAARIPDIIVSDYRLRNGRVGTEAVGRIRALAGRPIPGIILTGEIGVECRRDAEAQGLEIVYKPVTAFVLGETIDRHLRTAEGKPAVYPDRLR